MLHHQWMYQRNAELIREQLEAIGWTQAKLANRMNVAPSTVSGWATGRTLPNYESWAQLCLFLELPHPFLPPRTSVGEGLTLVWVNPNRLED